MKYKYCVYLVRFTMQRDTSFSIEVGGSDRFYTSDRQLDPRLKCRLCIELLKGPVQTRCGCRFCSQCLERYLKEGDLRCPTCKNYKIDKEKILKDKAVEREINQLLVQCQNDGCAEEVRIKDIPDHLMICNYREERCSECGECYIHAFKNEHVMHQCGRREISCELCEKRMTREEYVNSHRNYDRNADNICDRWVTFCPYGCGQKEELNLKDHLKECQKKPFECVLKELGCEHLGSRDSLNNHLKEDINFHQILLLKEIQKLSRTNIELKLIIDEKENEANEKIKGLLKNVSEYAEVITDLEKKIKEMEKSARMISAELRKHEKRNVDGNQLIKHVVTGADCATWTIRDIRNKIVEARTSNNQIISDSFYIYRPGYHLSLKIYPNGDGRGKGKYLSVFFVINKGDYDEMIPWPFKIKVSLTILSSRSRSNDTNIHMQPDNNLQCYGRPENIFNVGVGQPEIVKLSDITSSDCYLHDGALKVKITLKAGL